MLSVLAAVLMFVYLEPVRVYVMNIYLGVHMGGCMSMCMSEYG